MEVTKPYKFIGFGAMEVTNAYKFIGFGGAGILNPRFDRRVVCRGARGRPFRPFPADFLWDPRGAWAGIKQNTTYMSAATGTVTTKINELVTGRRITDRGPVCHGRFLMVLKPPGAAQTPKNDPNKSGQTAFGFGALGVTKPHEFIGFGALGVETQTTSSLTGPRPRLRRREFQISTISDSWRASGSKFSDSRLPWPSPHLRMVVRDSRSGPATWPPRDGPGGCPDGRELLEERPRGVRGELPVKNQRGSGGGGVGSPPGVCSSYPSCRYPGWILA
jgi:hypothetical protein